MWTEDEIRRAAINWRAVADVYLQNKDNEEVSGWQAGLAEGYASALEMILGDKN